MIGVILHFPTLKPSAPVIALIIIQIIILLLLITNFISIPAYTLGSIESLPPTGFVYFSNQVPWITAGRIISHLIIAPIEVILSVICIIYGLTRKLKMIKYITITMGVFLLCTAILHIAIAGAFAIGSWWHLAALIAAMVSAIVAASTVVVFVMLVRNMIILGQAHDDYIDSNKHQL